MKLFKYALAFAFFTFAIACSNDNSPQDTVEGLIALNAQDLETRGSICDDIKDCCQFASYLRIFSSNMETVQRANREDNGSPISTSRLWDSFRILQCSLRNCDFGSPGGPTTGVNYQDSYKRLNQALRNLVSNPTSENTSAAYKAYCQFIQALGQSGFSNWYNSNCSDWAEQVPVAAPC